MNVILKLFHQMTASYARPRMLCRRALLFLLVLCVAIIAKAEMPTKHFYMSVGRWHDIKIPDAGSAAELALYGRPLHSPQLPPPPMPESEEYRCNQYKQNNTNVEANHFTFDEDKKTFLAKGRQSRLFKKACEVNEVLACYKFGLFEFQNGNMPNAKRFFKKACDGGNMAGCWGQGAVEELFGDLIGAELLFRKACVGGDEVNCQKKFYEVASELARLPVVERRCQASAARDFKLKQAAMPNRELQQPIGSYNVLRHPTALQQLQKNAKAYIAHRRR